MTTAFVPEDAAYAPPPRRTRVKTRSEADIVSDALDYLRGVGYARKVHGGAHGNAGEPDIDACVRGRSVKLEAKRPGERPTPAQVGAMKRWADAGALAGWFTGNEHIVQILDHVDGGQDFVLDLSRPGCVCPVHAQRGE
jgi:hypothetical protein